jgi:sulfonate transport system substrate-binding protein
MYQNRRNIWIGSALLVGLSFVLVLNWAKLFPAELTQVRLGTSNSVTTSLMLIALDQGFFEEEGIDLIFEPYPSAQLALDDVFLDKLDLAIVSETPIVFKSFERDDFLILASVYSAYNDPKVIALKTNGIETPADLAGKTIATTKKGQSAHYFLHLFMSKYGLGEDIEIVYLSPSELIDGLGRGELDALSLFEPYISQAAQLLPTQTIIFSEPKLYYKSALLVAQQNFVAENPETIQGVLRALLHAEQFLVANRQESAQIISDRLGLDSADVDQAWEDAFISVALDQNLLLTLEFEANWAIEENFVEATTVPNFLNYIYFDGLEEIDTNRVIIIH